MLPTRRFKPFDDSLLDRHPELKEALMPNDQYPELMHFVKYKSVSLPYGSLNTKVIINDGEIVERVYRTPKGKVISLFSKQSNQILDQAA